MRSDLDPSDWANLNIKHVFSHKKQNFVMKFEYEQAGFQKELELDLDTYPGIGVNDFNTPGDNIFFEYFDIIAFQDTMGIRDPNPGTESMADLANVWFRSWEFTPTTDDDLKDYKDDEDNTEDNGNETSWCPEYAFWDTEKERCTLNDEYFELRKCNLDNGNMGFEFFRSKSFEKLYKLADQPGDKVFQYDFNEIQYNQYDNFEAFESADEQRQKDANSQHYFSMIAEDEKVTLIYSETFRSPSIDGVIIKDDVFLRLACEYDFGLITLDSSFEVVKTDIIKESVVSYSYHTKQGNIPYTISTAGKLKVGAPVTFTISPKHPGKFFANLHSCEVRSGEDKVELYPECAQHFGVEYHQSHGSNQNLTLKYNAFRFASTEHQAQNQKLVCVIDVQMKSSSEAAKVCTKQ